jgi:hypothetical protein
MVVRHAMPVPIEEISMKFLACAMVGTAMLFGASSLAFAASCKAELGAAKAATLVNRCTEVSPATHPPCNDANPCALIIGEIKRGCGILIKDNASDTPAYCRNY